jgi:hypothetical protein
VVVEKPTPELFDAMVSAILASASSEALIDLLIEKGILERSDAARLYRSIAHGLSTQVHKEHLAIPAKTAAETAQKLALFYATPEPPPSRN